MTPVNNRKNKLWLRKDAEFSAFEKTKKAPSFDLKNVPYINVKELSDLQEIPNRGGCYWIWTDEKIAHTFHTNELPQKFGNGEVIYNGIAKDDIRVRIKNHLFSEPNAGWSGISVDILLGNARSHRKKAMSKDTSKKVAYLNKQQINDKKQLLKLNLSKKEKTYVANTKSATLYFRNGINIEESKHRKNRFRVYFIVDITSASYLAFIEKKWRAKGLPRLCSYISGR